MGGDITRYWAKIMIELLKEEDIRIGVLRKHKFLKEGIKTEFRIVDRGIEPLRSESKIAESEEN